MMAVMWSYYILLWRYKSSRVKEPRFMMGIDICDVAPELVQSACLCMSGM